MAVFVGRLCLHPHVGALPVADVGTQNVLACLEPIWRAKPETASRVRGRIEAVLHAAKVRGLRSGENPAQWRGHLALLAAGQDQGPAHQTPRRVALWRMPGFMAALRVQPGFAAPGAGVRDFDGLRERTRR